MCLLMLVLCLLTVTGFDLWGAVLAMGLVCTLYTALVSPTGGTVTKYLPTIKDRETLRVSTFLQNTTTLWF